MASTEFSRGAHLVAARAWSEIPVGQVEFLDAERATLLLVIVDELILLYAGHDVRFAVRWRAVTVASSEEAEEKAISGVEGAEMQKRAAATKGRTPTVNMRK